MSIADRATDLAQGRDEHAQRELATFTTLAADGWSLRRIGRELGIHCETVGRYLSLWNS